MEVKSTEIDVDKINNMGWFQRYKENVRFCSIQSIVSRSYKKYGIKEIHSITSVQRMD